MHGVFIVNANRIAAGWGNVSENRWPYPKKVVWPPAEPPGLDKIAKFNRIYAYSRVRHLDDARRSIAYSAGFLVSLPIHSGWYKAPNGVISAPIAGQVFTGNHCVHVCGYDDQKQSFSFANSWGTGWGDKGYGYLPYNYFTRFAQDAWLPRWPYLPGQLKAKPSKKIICIDTLSTNALGYHCVVHDLWDLSDSTRVGWCFATERDHYLDVEEFFVRPEYRGKGTSRVLMSRLIQESDGAGLPLRFWIPHADLITPLRCILPMDHLLTKNGFVVSLSGVNWALYKAEQQKNTKTLKRSVSLEAPSTPQSPPSGVLDLNMRLAKIKLVKGRSKQVQLKKRSTKSPSTVGRNRKPKK